METYPLTYRSESWSDIWREAFDSRRGTWTFLAIARWAIKHAADAEPDPNVRRFRRTMLLRKWRAAFMTPAIL